MPTLSPSSTAIAEAITEAIAVDDCDLSTECVKPPNQTATARQKIPRYETLHMEGSYALPEVIYGRVFNEEWQCIISNGIERDRHG